ncbi:sugar phosphate nucleotidyltransferase, partial [Leptospira borgpetersenii]
MVEPIHKNEITVLILAAGLGTRLKPLTDRWPKCLMPISGKPLLEIWLDQISQL